MIRIDLSVIVSTYNQVKYIAECLDSIIVAISNINAEIIISDDCSTDGTYDVCMKYAMNYPTKVINLKRFFNLGGNKNYIRAHSHAKGLFVAHVDGDDIVEKLKFSRQLEFFDNENVNLVMHSSVYFSDNNKITHFPSLLGNTHNPSRFSRYDFATWGTIAVHSSYMYRRSAINFSVIYEPFMEWRVGMVLLKTGEGVFINERLVRYRFNQGGPAWTGSSAGRNKAYEIQFLDIKLFFDDEKSLRKNLYSQVLVNMVAILRAKSRVPDGMIMWLLKNIMYFRPLKFIESIYIRFKLRPKSVNVRRYI